MDKSVMLPLEKIQECIALGQSFVLQGGAGSGKTDTLKKQSNFILKITLTRKLFVSPILIKLLMK